MEFTAQIIAGYIQGRVDGDPEAKVFDVSKIEEGKPGTLCFLSNPKYEKFLYTTDASVVIVNNDLEPAYPVKTTLIRVADAYKAFAQLLELYNSFNPEKKGIEQPSFVAESANLGENIYIGAFSYIGKNVSLGNNVKIYPQVFIDDNVKIGDYSIIFAGVKIYHDCIIGENVTIHSGSVIGADGFGFAPQSEDNVYKKIPQIGNVIIEDTVEIGANSTVDRATMGSTILRKGVKLDNMVHIAHNVEVGSNTVMAAQTGVAGSTKIGRDCMFGGKVGIAPHISIADGVKLGAMSGVNSSIKKENTIMIGAPVMPYADFMKCWAIFRHLPEMNRAIDELKKGEKNLKM
jgi:UDP-3-O-[3-hydroxymyristoyl] glucosamine N-acyltransferase